MKNGDQTVYLTRHRQIQWKKNQKVLDDFWRRKLTLKVKLQHFLTHHHYANFQNAMILFDYSWFLAKNLSNFVSLPQKLHNRYCHTSHLCYAIPDWLEVLFCASWTWLEWPWTIFPNGFFVNTLLLFTQIPAMKIKSPLFFLIIVCTLVSKNS